MSNHSAEPTPFEEPLSTAPEDALSPELSDESLELEDSDQPEDALDDVQDADDLEESISTYMSDLLQRMSDSNRADEDPIADHGLQELAPTNDNLEIEVMEEKEPEKPKPRVRAALPESLLDMSAMRDVANASARGAIDTHSQRQATRSALRGLLLAGVVIVTTIILGQIAMVSLSSRLAGTLFGLLVSMYLCMRYHRITADLATISGDNPVVPVSADAEQEFRGASS